MKEVFFQFNNSRAKLEEVKWQATQMVVVHKAEKERLR